MFTKIPDKSASNNIMKYKFIQVFKSVSTIKKCSHVIHHVFGGWLSVEKNTKHHVFYDCELMRRRPINTSAAMTDLEEGVGVLEEPAGDRMARFVEGDGLLLLRLQHLRLLLQT